MIGGSRMKIYDILAFIGIVIIIGTTLYVDLITGIYVMGAFFIAIALVMAKADASSPPKGKGGEI